MWTTGYGLGNSKEGEKKISTLHNVKFMLSQKNKGPSDMQLEQNIEGGHRDGGSGVSSELVTFWGHGCVGAQCC